VKEAATRLRLRYREIPRSETADHAVIKSAVVRDRSSVH
jgi:hypothetical protein